MIEASTGIRPLAGLRDLDGAYDVVLCDVWGVVHDGVRVHREATTALARFRAGGGTVVLITNAPRPARPILHQLDEFGAPRDAYDAVVTSGDVTLALMAARGGAPVHHIGPARDLSLFAEFEALTSFEAPRVDLASADYVLCTGLFDDEHELPEDYDRTLEEMGRRDLTMICANPDIVVHRGERLLYCAGALAARYVAHGGKAVFAGKPHAPIYSRALEVAAEIRRAPVVASRVLAIGDGLRTDIVGAATYGIDSLFVTGGIHRDELVGSDGHVDPERYARALESIERAPVGALHGLAW